MLNREDIIDKHMSKVSPEALTGCWLWTAASDKHGYGMVWHDGKMDRAHRVFYAAANKENISGKSVLHSCDTPSCVNPIHLHIGTHADNMKEKAIRERAFKKLRTPIVNTIRLQLECGRSQRWIAKFWGVSQRTIWNINKGLTWNVNK